MNNNIPIKTEVGIISGRDAVYLDSFSYEGNTITIKGELNGNLCSEVKEKDAWIPYTLTFKGVLYLKMEELDFSGYDKEWSSSFDIINNSNVIKNFFDSENNKIKKEHKHYLLHTYDDVIEVISSDFSLVLGKARKQK